MAGCAPQVARNYLQHTQRSGDQTRAPSCRRISFLRATYLAIRAASVLHAAHWDNTSTSSPSRSGLFRVRSHPLDSWECKYTYHLLNISAFAQAQVDAAPTFPDVMRNFEQWLISHKLLTKKAKHLQPNVVFATDGPWDLCSFASKSFHLSRCPKPSWFPQTYLNIRGLVSDWYVKHQVAKDLEKKLSNQVSRSGLARTEPYQRA